MKKYFEGETSEYEGSETFVGRQPAARASEDILQCVFACFVYIFRHMFRRQRGRVAKLLTEGKFVMEVGKFQLLPDQLFGHWNFIKVMMVNFKFNGMLVDVYRLIVVKSYTIYIYGVHSGCGRSTWDACCS